MKRADAREAAEHALLRLLEPLAGFSIDAGLSAKELRSIFCQATVRAAICRQREKSHRTNISGISATTGISRAEISRILKANRSGQVSRDRDQNSTNRILIAWHAEPKFTDSRGQPLDLKLYGRGATFETLVKKFGRGIPTRAVLDELVRACAVQVLSSQKVRVKATLAVARGFSSQAIRAFGDRATELLNTMLANMREPEHPQFVASVSGSPVEPKAVVLRELSAKSADFLADIQENLIQVKSDSRRKSGSTMSVTVYCHEAPVNKINQCPSTRTRRNFRRTP